MACARDICSNTIFTSSFKDCSFGKVCLTSLKAWCSYNVGM